MVRPDIIIAIAGVYTDGAWNSPQEASALIKKLPLNPSKEDIDTFSMEWSKKFLGHYKTRFIAKDSKALPIGSDNVTVFVATRINGIPYLSRTAAGFIKGEPVAEETAPPYRGHFTTVHFAGSCRDNIRVNGTFVDRPSDDDIAALGKIEDTHTITGMLDVAMRYEKILTKISEHKNKCYVGGPYDYATWEKDKPSWDIHIKGICRTSKRTTHR